MRRLLPILALLALALPAWATTYTATSSTTWSAEVWSPAGTPGAGDTVETGTYTVTIDQSIAVGTIQNTAGGGYSVTAGGRTLTCNVLALCGNAAAMQAVGVPADIAAGLTTTDKAVLDAAVSVLQPLDAIPVDEGLFRQFLGLLRSRGILRDRTYGELTVTVEQQIGLVTTRPGSRAEQLWGDAATFEAVATAVTEVARG